MPNWRLHGDCSWVKGFAAFKRNVPVAYAWEPVIIKPARKPVVSKRLATKDGVTVIFGGSA